MIYDRHFGTIEEWQARYDTIMKDERFATQKGWWSAMTGAEHSLKTPEAREEVVMFAVQTVDRIAHPQAEKEAPHFEITKLIALKFRRPDERANLQNHIEALKEGRYALDMERRQHRSGTEMEEMGLQLDEIGETCRNDQHELN